MSTILNEHNIEKFLEQAVGLSERSTIKTYQTGAIIVSKDGRKVSTGWSHDSTFKLTNFRSIHAEVHAIFRAQRDTLKGATIFVARTRNDNVGMARPCDGCFSYLYEVEIRRAYYTFDFTNYDYVDIWS